MSTTTRIRASQASKTTLPPLNSFAGAPPVTVLDWLEIRFPKVPRHLWEQRMDRGDVTFEAAGKLPACVVRKDQRYAERRCLRYFREVEAAEEPKIPFVETVVYEDENLLVVDKPPFLPVVPSGPFVRECLLERLRATHGGDLAPLHRLDRLTTGLVMFARHVEHRGAYVELFAQQRIKKTYKAMAKVPEPVVEKMWTVRSRIVVGKPFFRMTEEAGGTANAETTVRLISRDDDGLAIFDLQPRTGKTHQLRVHMASLGWPLLGDPLYPQLLPKAPDDWQQPLRLLAERLSFRDPLSGREHSLCSGYRIENLPERGLGNIGVASGASPPRCSAY